MLWRRQGERSIVVQYCFALGDNVYTRHGVMIYSHKWLMIYTASRDYGVKRKSITLSHHNKIRHSGFYFTFQGKISSTQWISPVKDGFRCAALLRFRGFLHAFHLVEMTVPRKKRHINRSPVIQRVWKKPKNLLERSSFLVKNNWPSTVISSEVERSPSLWYE